MDRFLKKTLTGFREVAQEDAEYYLQTIEDYYRDMDKFQKMKQHLATIEQEHSEELGRLTMNALRDSTYEVKEVKYEAQQKYDALYKKYSDTIKENKALIDENTELLERALRFEALNKNLLRVSRERANTGNGQDKKTASGFVVINTSQIRDKLTNTNGYDEYFNTWKTRIRTHFDASLPESTIIPEIMNAFEEEVFGALGIEGISNEKDLLNNEPGLENCVVYRWSLSANFLQSSLWEVDLYHTQSIYIPDDYRPIRPQKKDRTR